jgi:transcriptional regulator with XRE-family HTH domain
MISNMGVDTKNVFRADRLRRLREQHGWSQRELGRRCGFGDSQIRKYENSAIEPTATNLKIMADELGVSADYLLSATDDPIEHIEDGRIDQDEQALLETLRREGWLGVAHLSVERLYKASGSAVGN